MFPARQSGEISERASADRRHERERVEINCEIRVGTKAWRKAQIADLTPEGFQVRIFDMPPRGTTLFLRFAGIQMLNAEVCWARADTAGCRFVVPISQYVFDHIIATAR
ncbi:PilZ domain-containing protein [Erythrobacter sp. EC-HK427]|uniref:PilZ domain-containing protein n=1 Tax=Erythrobacter sp. EC-HK427 TaxID=2038396 RepID=UPI00125B2838|nr:PilZ domain-containing protein [Erythrobacter sp. EC-HK427]VVT01830.1 conserved hypothetical protein [Erythrobacter sp. EC-HK427]